jgi:type II secretion system protein H
MSPRRHEHDIQRRTAFTLLEVLLVIIIMSVMASVLLMDLDGILHRDDLPESTRRVQAALAMCRAEAMNNTRRYRLRFHKDGTIDITRQLDPLVAAHLVGQIKTDWAGNELLVGDVWVESVQKLPSGPPPLNVQDEELDLTKYDTELPTAVAEMSAPAEIWFEPDGTSGSARWTLRKKDGTGTRMLLDGRFGRVTMEDVPRIVDQTVERPQALPAEEKNLGIVTNEREVLDEMRKGEPQ